jgi:GTPase SAR1 family protein
MIVVEGPDGSGKTTLIKEIQSEFAVTIAPRVVSKEAEALLDLRVWVEQNNRKLDQGVVYDRHRLISETIYGPILRDGTEPGFDDINWLAEQMHQFYAKRPVIIYCLPAKGVVLENRSSLPSKATYQQASNIYDLYVARTAIDNAFGRSVIYDYTKGSRHLANIMGHINRNEMF